MTRFVGSLALLTLGLAACSAPQQPAQESNASAPPQADAAAMPATPATPTRAVAQLRTAQGAAAGTVTATPANGGVMISVQAEGLPAGAHGVHVHMTGKCEAPKFETAGGHWNPTSAKHGLENPQGQHAGDMPNLTIDPAGRGATDYELKGATFAGLMDGDGSAFVVHASADDQRTDPSGASGDRIACGVFAPG